MLAGTTAPPIEGAYSAVKIILHVYDSVSGLSILR